MTDTQQIADWDMTTYFSAIGASDYREFRTRLHSDIEALRKELDSAPPPDKASVSLWTQHLNALEDISARTEHLTSYYDCMGAADSREEQVKRDSAQHASTSARLQKLFVVVRARLDMCTSTDFAALLANAKLVGAEHFLTRLRRESEMSMEPELESLSAELSVDGLAAWGRLYDQVSGTLDFDLEVPGEETRRLPVSMSRSLLEDASPAVRQAAFAGSGRAWESVADAVAAALNAISGTRLTLYKRRGIDHYLDPALFDAGITRQTLDCMLDVVRSRQAMPQAYLTRKASLLGVDRLGFCDLMAPVSTGSDERVSWERGADQVQAAFEHSYPKLAALSSKAFAERWIDHAPRPGKRPGGFCSSSSITGQSRIFMTFNGGMGDVQTLAHELGHSFHSYLMRDLRPWAGHYPMTLAETASTFAENLVTNAALESPGCRDEDKKRILDQRLQHSAAFLLNIPTRFDFECALYEKRSEGELSVSALKELMLEAQRKNYGESLDPNRLDPWFWASKLHFYITELSFYNFPYTFGYLFSMGLFARFLADGEDFLPRYEALLMQTGSAPAEEVARNALGVNLEQPEFWNATIDFIEKDWQSFARFTE